MMNLSTSVEGRGIPMTPDGTVVWRQHSFAEGDLYLPPGADLQQASLVLQPPTGKPFAQGNSGGKLYEATLGTDDVVAVKEFSESIAWKLDDRGRLARDLKGERGGLSTLRANLMLATGLTRIDQTHNMWRFKGAEVLGVFVLNVASDQTPAHDTLYARWLVRRAIPVPGVDPHDYMQYRTGVLGILNVSDQAINPTAKPALPNIKRRRQLYAEALGRVGANAGMGGTINIDDHPANVIIEKMPVLKGWFFPEVQEQGVVTKIDLSAENLEF